MNNTRTKEENNTKKEKISKRRKFQKTDYVSVGFVTGNSAEFTHIKIGPSKKLISAPKYFHSQNTNH